MSSNYRDDLKFAYPFFEDILDHGSGCRQSAATFLRFGDRLFYARIQWDNVPDFCGGTAINSPQVIELRPTSWGQDHHNAFVAEAIARLPDMLSRGGTPFVTRTRDKSRETFMEKCFSALAAFAVSKTLHCSKGSFSAAGPSYADDEYREETFAQRYGVANLFRQAGALPELDNLVCTNLRVYPTGEEACVSTSEAFENPNTGRACAWHIWGAVPPDTNWEFHAQPVVGPDHPAYDPGEDYDDWEDEYDEDYVSTRPEWLDEYSRTEAAVRALFVENEFCQARYSPRIFWGVG